FKRVPVIGRELCTKNSKKWPRNTPRISWSYEQALAKRNLKVQEIRQDHQHHTQRSTVMRKLLNGILVTMLLLAAIQLVGAGGDDARGVINKSIQAIGGEAKLAK